eukprot:9070478-Pyramimonas_sp.AAC.1
MGNAWADCFAKFGARDVAVAQVAVDALRRSVKECKCTFEFLSRAMHLICARPEAQDSNPPPPKPVPERRDVLVHIAHDRVP